MTVGPRAILYLADCLNNGFISECAVAVYWVLLRCFFGLPAGTVFFGDKPVCKEILQKESGTGCFGLFIVCAAVFCLLFIFYGGQQRFASAVSVAWPGPWGYLRMLYFWIFL